MANGPLAIDCGEWATENLVTVNVTLLHFY